MTHRYITLYMYTYMYCMLYWLYVYTDDIIPCVKFVCIIMCKYLSYYTYMHNQLVRGRRIAIHTSSEFANTIDLRYIAVIYNTITHKNNSYKDITSASWAMGCLSWNFQINEAAIYRKRTVYQRNGDDLGLYVRSTLSECNHPHTFGIHDSPSCISEQHETGG